MFVHKLHPELTSEELGDFFVDCGKVLEAIVIKRENDPKFNKGFGFVTFEKEESFLLALDKGK